MCGLSSYLQKLLAEEGTITSADQYARNVSTSFFDKCFCFLCLYSQLAISILRVLSLYWSGRSGVRILARARNFSFLQNIQTGSGPHRLLFNGYRGSFRGLKRLEREVNHSSPSSVEDKKEWSYTSTPPLYLHGIGRSNVTLLTRCK